MKMMKYLTAALVTLTLSGCSQNQESTSQVQDIGLINISQSNKNYVAFRNGESTVTLFQCHENASLPLNRDCPTVGGQSIDLTDFKNSLPLPTGGFSRTHAGLDIATLALDRARQNGRPESEIKQIEWHHYNIQVILDYVNSMGIGEEVTYLSNEDSYGEIVGAIRRFYKDPTSGRRYRYIGDGAAWDGAYLCSQLGGGNWQPVTKGEQITKTIIADILNSSVGSELSLTRMDGAETAVISFGSECSESRTVIYGPASKLGRLTSSDIDTTTATSSTSSICEMELPIFCVAN